MAQARWALIQYFSFAGASASFARNDLHCQAPTRVEFRVFDLSEQLLDPFHQLERFAPSTAL